MRMVKIIDDTTGEEYTFRYLNAETIKEIKRICMRDITTEDRMILAMIKEENNADSN